MIAILVTRVIKSQLAEPLSLGLVIILVVFLTLVTFSSKRQRENKFLLPDAGMTGGCLKYHQCKMHMLDTTSVLLCITRICPCSLETDVIFGILFPQKEFRNTWLVFIKRCFSLPCICSGKMKGEAVKQMVLPAFIWKLRIKLSCFQWTALSVSDTSSLHGLKRHMNPQHVNETVMPRFCMSALLKLKMTPAVFK